MIKIKEVVVNVKQLEKLDEIASMNLKAINKAVKFGIKKFKDKANAKIDQCYQMIEAKEQECIDLQDELQEFNDRFMKLRVESVKKCIEHSKLKKEHDALVELRNSDEIKLKYLNKSNDEYWNKLLDAQRSIFDYQNEIFDLERRLTNRNWLIAGIIVIGTLISIYFNL